MGQSFMEAEFIAWAKRRVSKLPAPELGIGDDAAVLKWNIASIPSSLLPQIVLTTDALGDGTHFKLSEHAPRRIGRKAAAVNLSDIAAMGAKANSLLVSFTLPRSASANLARELFEGICEMAEQFGVSIAGGDTNCWDGPLNICITAVGEVQGNEVWRRSGAKPGDLAVVTGPVGGSILGKHLDFTPRLDLSEKLAGKGLVHAATDVSDGLALDLHHLGTDSRMGVIVDLEKIPISEAAQKLAQSTGKTPLQHALGDGEDFELLLAVPPSSVPSLQSLGLWDNFFVVGEFTQRTGLWSRIGQKLQQLPPIGYSHG
jgi:thiamine-monophosphate kinase